MSLTNALSSSVSGLNVASTAIAVIGDNIANANTAGFKEKRAEFSAVLGQSIAAGSGFAQIGAGTLVNDVRSIFSQGVFETSARGTDLGIAGPGFFVMDGAQGRSFTRAGSFGFDSGGVLVDSAGNRVQGFGIDPATGQSNGVLGDIQVNTPLSPPQATSTIDLSMNLDPTAPLIGPFDPATAQTTSNAREGITIFDSLGTPRQATIFFTKTGVNTWDYNVALSDADAGTPTGNPFVVQGTGTLGFDTNGGLTSFTGGAISFDLNAANGAGSPQAVAFDMGPLVGSNLPGDVTTQFNQPAVTNSVGQDGFRPGTLRVLGIDGSGRLSGVFTNGVTSTVAQIALANFRSVEGLTEIGGSQLIESIDSGSPLIAAANSGNLGGIRSNSLEKSNVDLAQQFVNLIIAQRAFQANTRTVSVANELMSNLVNLGQ